MPTKKTKKPRPSGVTVRKLRSGEIQIKAYGPSAPDLRTVIPQLLGTSTARPTSPSRSHTGEDQIPKAFCDSLATSDAEISVEVKRSRGASEEIEVKITPPAIVPPALDCGGTIYGDEDTIGQLIEMLQHARANLLARRGAASR